MSSAFFGCDKEQPRRANQAIVPAPGNELRRLTPQKTEGILTTSGRDTVIFSRPQHGRPNRPERHAGLPPSSGLGGPAVRWFRLRRATLEIFGAPARVSRSDPGFLDGGTAGLPPAAFSSPLPILHFPFRFTGLAGKKLHLSPKKRGPTQTGQPPIFLVPRAGIEPARGHAPRDFKSLASTYSATQAFCRDGWPRFHRSIEHDGPYFKTKAMEN